MTSSTPVSKMRRGLIKAMVKSAAVPQFTLDRELGVSSLVEARASAKAGGADVSLTDLLVAALARALAAYPDINASLIDDAIVRHQQVNVGLVLALPGAVVAPAIFDTARRSLTELASERRRLVAAAAGGALTMEELTSATSSLSNLGTFSVDRFRALITPPQASVLAVGSTREILAPRDGQAAIVQVISVTASFDHRVVDGAPAAQFLDHFAQDVEHPAWISAALVSPVGVGLV